MKHLFLKIFYFKNSTRYSSSLLKCFSLFKLEYLSLETQVSIKFTKKFLLFENFKLWKKLIYLLNKFYSFI